MGKKKGPAKAQPGQEGAQAALPGKSDAGSSHPKDDAQAQRHAELIKEHLGRQLGGAPPPADAAGTSAGSGAHGDAAVGAEADAGDRPAGTEDASEAAAELLQRLAAEACMSPADVKPALSAYLASSQLSKDQADQLAELEQQLAKQRAPVAYQRLSALLKPGKKAPVLMADPARLDGELSKEVLDRSALSQLASTLQVDPQSSVSAAIKAMQVLKTSVPTDDFFSRGCLWKKALPQLSQLRPCPEPAGSGGEGGGGGSEGESDQELASLVQLICQEAPRLAQQRRRLQAGDQEAGSSSDEEEEAERGWPASALPDAERYLARLLEGLGLAGDVLASGEPAIAAFQAFHVPKYGPRSQAASLAIHAFLRGHLLMALQQQAAAAGLQGNSPEAQQLVRPLQLLLDRPKVPLRDLAAAACMQAGAPEHSRLLHLAASLLRMGPEHARRGLLWRLAALLLLLLPRQAQAAAAGRQAEDQVEALSGMLDLLEGADLDDPFAPFSTQHEAVALSCLQTALGSAAELAAPVGRCRLAGAVLLALQRMQRRDRLTTKLVEAMGGCQALQSAAAAAAGKPLPDLRKLTELPLDQLIMSYCLVAIAFGCAFQTPEDLGPTPPEGAALSAPPGIDFAAAGAMARAGLSWESAAQRSQGGARLCLNAHAVQGALHQAAQGGDTQPAHCSVGWCGTCNVVVPEPSAGPEDMLSAVAGLAAGSLGMPGSVASAGGGGDGWKDASLRVGEVLVGAPATEGSQALLSRLPVSPEQGARLARLLCLMCSTCLAAVQALGGALERHGGQYHALFQIGAALQKGLPLTVDPEILKGLAEHAPRLVELEQVAAAAHRMIMHLQLLGNMSRMNASQPAIEAIMAGTDLAARLSCQLWLRCSAQERQELNTQIVVHTALLDPSVEAARWPKALQVSLGVLAAQLRAHAGQQAAGATPEPFFFPAPGLVTPVVQCVVRLQNTHRLFERAFLGLRGAAEALFWQTKDVLGQLRPACAVQLLAPFEELLVQQVLGKRWLAEAGGVALDAAAESAASEIAAAEAAAAEAAAKLEQEEAEAQAAQQRWQQKQLEKQRAAELKRQQQAEEERRRRKREEQERARQAEEEARRQAEAEAHAAAAREEEERQRRAFALSMRQAEDNEAAVEEEGNEGSGSEDGSDSEGKGGHSGADAATGERHPRGGRKRGGRSRQRHAERQRREAEAKAAAAGQPGQEAASGVEPPAPAQQRAAAPASATASAAVPATQTAQASNKVQPKDAPPQQRAEPAAADRQRQQQSAAVTARQQLPVAAQQAAAAAQAPALAKQPVAVGAPVRQPAAAQQGPSKQAAAAQAPATQQAAAQQASAAHASVAATAGQQPPAAQGAPTGRQQQQQAPAVGRVPAVKQQPAPVPGVPPGKQQRQQQQQPPPVIQPAAQQEQHQQQQPGWRALSAALPQPQQQPHQQQQPPSHSQAAQQQGGQPLSRHDSRASLEGAPLSRHSSSGSLEPGLGAARGSGGSGAPPDAHKTRIIAATRTKGRQSPEAQPAPGRDDATQAVAPPSAPAAAAAPVPPAPAAGARAAPKAGAAARQAAAADGAGAVPQSSLPSSEEAAVRPAAATALAPAAAAARPHEQQQPQQPQPPQPPQQQRWAAVAGQAPSLPSQAPPPAEQQPSMVQPPPLFVPPAGQAMPPPGGVPPAQVPAAQAAAAPALQPPLWPQHAMHPSHVHAYAPGMPMPASSMPAMPYMQGMPAQHAHHGYHMQHAQHAAAPPVATDPGANGWSDPAVAARIAADAARWYSPTQVRAAAGQPPSHAAAPPPRQYAAPAASAGRAVPAVRQAPAQPAGARAPQPGTGAAAAAKAQPASGTPAPAAAAPASRPARARAAEAATVPAAATKQVAAQAAAGPAAAAAAKPAAAAPAAAAAAKPAAARAGAPAAAAARAGPPQAAAQAPAVASRAAPAAAQAAKPAAAAAAAQEATVTSPAPAPEAPAAAPARAPSPAAEQAPSPAEEERASSPAVGRVPSPAPAAGPAAAGPAAPAPAAAPAGSGPSPAAPQEAGPRPGTWAALAAAKPKAAAAPQQPAPKAQQLLPAGAVPVAKQEQPAGAVPAAKQEQQAGAAQGRAEPAAQPQRKQQQAAATKPAAQAPQQPSAEPEPAPLWPGLVPAQGPAKGGSKPAADAAAAAAAKPAWDPATPAAAAPTAAAAAGAAVAPRAAAAATAGGLAPGVPQPPRISFLAALAPDQAEVAALALPGLRNEAGEFNCFLNVVVQCLWRCRDFRESVLSWDPQVIASDAVLCALHSLLSELSAMDYARQEAAAAGAGGGSAGSAGERPVIDPTPLREAINALPGQEFKIGEMSDAGELLLVLYEHLKAAAPGRPAAELDAAFGLHVHEAVRCTKCPRTTQEQRYTQYFCNVSAAALRASLRGADPGFGARLRAIEDEHQKSCDTDVGGCGALYPVSHSLEGGPPRVFTLQLVWESHSQEPAAIGATMRAVGEQVNLSQLYEGVPPGTASRYRLRAMVCYYLRHYSAFVRLPELGDRWVMFNDASASAAGAWAEVQRRCEGGRVQPSVLFYEAEA
ncbi:hypothetical protein ABPG75_004233 [Micractinium tetrahymenae]